MLRLFCKVSEAGEEDKGWRLMLRSGAQPLNGCGWVEKSVVCGGWSVTGAGVLRS